MKLYWHMQGTPSHPPRLSRFSSLIDLFQSVSLSVCVSLFSFLRFPSFRPACPLYPLRPLRPVYPFHPFHPFHPLRPLRPLLFPHFLLPIIHTFSFLRIASFLYCPHSLVSCLLSPSTSLSTSLSRATLSAFDPPLPLSRSGLGHSSPDCGYPNTLATDHTLPATKTKKMPQLLESTRNYLKTSTRLGRRMSQYKDEASGSETSLHLPVDTGSAHSGDHATGIVDTPPHRHTAQRRLSSLFGFEDRSKNAAPEDRATIMSRRVFPEPQDPPITHSDRMIRRNSRGSERTHRSGKSKSSHQSIWSREGSGNTLSKSHDHGSVHMEQEVPRGRSPTLSLSNTVSTAASTYDTRPSDYASMKHYQAHVWRRNLLEESIMHSLKLGYAERRRSSSRHRSLSSKNDSPRARKTREQALLAAAMGRDLATCPESEVTTFDRNPEPQVNIIDRSLGNISAMQARHQQQQQQQQPQFRRETNSPYQMDYNASMANITQSFASFTLELPEHQVEHVMNSSMVPDLFKVRASIPRVTEQRARTRRNSGATQGGGVSMSPRVLTGKKPHSQEDSQSANPHTEDNAPQSATSWAHSVHTALDQTKGTTIKGTTEDQLKALQVSEARAV